MVTAVVLHVCGVGIDAIAADYAESDAWGCSPSGQDIMLQAMPERYRERIREWNTPPEEEAEPFSQPFFWAQFGKWCGADASTMQKVFLRVGRKWGSMDGYLDTIGFDGAKRAKLAAAFTTAA